MPREITQRLLAVLQLTRMALVFTAISNSLCTLLIHTPCPSGVGLFQILDPSLIVAVVLISIGLYGMGMSLNDIIDCRRDRLIAAHRPLPSGRIGMRSAYAVCISMAALALAATVYYCLFTGSGWASLAMLLGTMALIGFYDYAGKYLVTSGLVTLGLIRFCQAAIPSPALPVIWHPLLLFSHVTLLSMFAYQWEEKRPRLTPRHRAAVLTAVVLVNVLVLGIAAWLAAWSPRPTALSLRIELLIPLALAGLFAFLAWCIRRRYQSLHQAGQTLMLAGLLWLIVYDAVFVGIYVGWSYAAVHLLLVPLSYLCVIVMRWWSRIVLVSQRPDFKLARNPQDIHKQI